MLELNVGSVEGWDDADDWNDGGDEGSNEGWLDGCEEG